MALRAEERLGPYQILGSIASGGMGEVYRAHDPRLDRPVAIKVLPPGVAANPERVGRFEQEARATGRLSHPNVLVVHDVGSQDGVRYLVTELLEGETLRGRLAGAPLPVRKAVDYALQVARGLAAAHDRGIVHRDLKPENIFVTNDGVVKILDFGLARLDPWHEDSTAAPGADSTRSGVVLGTVGYMSPEQVEGGFADARSDIFALGAVLYEMLAGRRAFACSTAVETLAAVLKSEPPDYPPDRVVPAPLDRIVRHCLEKKPRDRFQSALDLVFQLEGFAALVEDSDGVARSRGSTARRRWRPLAGLLVATFAVCAGAVLFLLWREGAGSGALRFERLTFRRGTVWSARFAQDGHTVVYSAAWEGQAIRVFTTQSGNAESRPMDLPDSEVLAISRTNELALSLGHDRYTFAGWSSGTLARAPLGGGAPRALREQVRGADWGPDGKDLAIVRQLARGSGKLEFPIGTVLAERSSSKELCCPRVSPRGDRVAFVDRSAVSVVDRSGSVSRLTIPLKRRPSSLAWSPRGDEIWFGASVQGAEWAIYAVDLRGRLRRVADLPTAGHLQDVRQDGRALITLHDDRSEILARPPSAKEEKNISWLDFSALAEISRDGRVVLFRETGHGGARSHPWYLRPTDGSGPAVLVAEARGWNSSATLSPDGAWILLYTAERPRELQLVPTGPGEPKSVTLEGIEVLGAEAARSRFLLADDRRFVFRGKQDGRPPRSWLLDMYEGTPRPVTPEGEFIEGLSPDGTVAVARDATGRLLLYSIAGGEPRLAAGGPENRPIVTCSADGRTVLVREVDETNGLAVRVLRRDLATGRRELWKELRPRDQAGLVGIGIVVSADERAYAYSVVRSLSSLYLVEGLR